MGFGSPIHWIIVVALIVLLFGSGRVSNLMGDVAKGIKSFKKGLAEDDETPAPPRRLSDERVIDAAPRADEAPAAERGSASEADRH
ncbi:twin-arginine translocase TatA/TatE family subunit [Sphingosinicella ginsenosidimutans]|uniref:Sec-independent protein translocase protein TatA n=1 Tax=Allosphingosinicella ginsenosidimutans TaxID=1176539 RepID=A0A5C6TQF9_9SPHN|nr:twin-arginine translocase TatA/TatE family subunit [Sphingosinicella ginsenosidimutans]TXC62687.1 twin-arginine translocase TatA/TatE family subunit [Sphingosinicella ginsenosidimutans]